MKIVVSGSLAYDRIMDFPGKFSDHILPEKIHILNVAFQVNGVKVRFGGTAGNIAYALTLLGERPVISATIGHDYHPYFAWLAKNGISTDNIKIIEEDFTASAYITTDLLNNQITGFHPGAMKYSSSLDFDHLDPIDTMVIISPGNLDDMAKYPGQCKALGVDYIFDPGQSLPMLSAKELVQAIDGCRMLVSNEYEMELILKKTGLGQESLLDLAGTIIVTRGELGSRVFTHEGSIDVQAVKPARVLDPTGVGDSYRGGLIAGLARGLSLEQAARMGTVCASFCLECYGTQDYRFSLQEFNERLAAAGRSLS
jgi:adenosine kinase